MAADRRGARLIDPRPPRDPVDAARRDFLATGVAAPLAFVFGLGGARAATRADTPSVDVLRAWYRLALELVRHTPTHSPPVASRTFAYLGVTALEAVAAGDQSMTSLAGQLNGLSARPDPPTGARLDEAVVLQSAMAATVRHFFANTGPAGARAIAAIEARLDEVVSDGPPADEFARSQSYGNTLANHVIAWSRGDGGTTIENMGFPTVFALGKGPGRWKPTSAIAQQQTPLLPEWGTNRVFALPDGGFCDALPPPAYSEIPGSAFHDEAVEVVATQAVLTDDQRAVARFWSDDPMLSPTPPGHWISIAAQVLDAQGADAATRADVLARLGIAMADGFIVCWRSKFEHDLLRPVTYIRRLIDPAWAPFLTTPPFPEYPSGHSTQSASAAEVLTDRFGDGFAFEDTTHADDGLPSRAFPSFRAAAEEAGLSRLYGGIHFRSAVERGLDQGQCVAVYANALVTGR